MKIPMLLPLVWAMGVGSAWASDPKVEKPTPEVRLQRRTDPKKGTLRAALEMQRYYLQVQLVDFVDGQVLVKPADALPQAKASALLVDLKLLSEVQFKRRLGTEVRLEITRDSRGDRRVTQILPLEPPR